MEIIDNLELILRLLLAAVCGVFVGLERKNRSKEAGIKTHCVVAFASALMMVLSKYAYQDMLQSGGEIYRLDPSRVASGVVSGIGFLCAGMIFVSNKTVNGLTTAAGMWATTGIGMAIGAGLYAVGIASTVFILLIQIVFHSEFLNRFAIFSDADAEEPPEDTGTQPVTASVQSDIPETSPETAKPDQEEIKQEPLQESSDKMPVL